jgi:hypothetical protein
MTPEQQQRLNTIIEALEKVQAQAPTKTTYSMGKADHSISNQLLPIIAELKALADVAIIEPVMPKDPAKTGK